ncbi:MAG: hypothetical protein JSW07_12880 [bacterium]|nr:MAG: hypothetical protein JSW07_12880 [bacterium]
MLFHEKYLDVLQNIEFGIVQIYRKYPELHDYDVMNALEALIDFYVAQKIDRNPRDFFLSDRAMLVFENVKNSCEWRLGRKPIEIESINMEGGEIDEIETVPKKLDEIINCLKKILSSVKKWNKRGGRQGYLSFVSPFIK